jgi:hypothetical protein
MQEKIILYSTDCPKCRILEAKLDKKNIIYVIKNNTNEMIEMGFKSVPMLEVNGLVMDFIQAFKWIEEKD